MPILYISEFSRAMMAQSGQPQICSLDDLIVQQAPLSFTATAGQSAAFNVGTKVVRIEADTACAILYGSNPTATASNALRLAAGAAEYFGVTPGMKVSAITVT